LITPSLAFDVCHDVYRSIRADLEGIALIDPTKVPSDHLWRADRGPRAAEYVADFSLCCKRALEGPSNAPRLQLCLLYHLALLPYERVRNFMGIRDDVAANWLDDIRDKAGKEIMGRGMFPVRMYFGERSRPRRHNGKVGHINGKIPSAHTAKHSADGIAYVVSDPYLLRGLRRTENNA
jgi:hypothetical protein